MGQKHLKMRTEICHFSGMAIYPGHGKTYIKADGKRVILINGKSEKKLKAKKNPRKITWTILYRRKHKKGSMTEIESRKRNRRALKAQRGIGGHLGPRFRLKRPLNLKSGKLSETWLLPPPSKRRRKLLLLRRRRPLPPRKPHQNLPPLFQRTRKLLPKVPPRTSKSK